MSDFPFSGTYVGAAPSRRVRIADGPTATVGRTPETKDEDVYDA